MAGGVCMACPSRAVHTRKRSCSKCGKTIFVCQGCTAREVNYRAPIKCRACQPKVRPPTRR